ncbi:hypothetical protein [Streptomyces sp. NPDC002785]|uniref:hypothetical protein n=1 Tax=Streptomyces sp. NPDC002785 TaxID=3154543 RepID=UPI00333489AD
MEPAEQRLPVHRVFVKLFGETDRLAGVLDDDPFVADTAERLALDELAGQSVADQSRTILLCWLTAADLQFHELARAHTRDRRQREDHRSGPDQGLRPFRDPEAVEDDED